jgi:hypothetical protein
VCHMCGLSVVAFQNNREHANFRWTCPCPTTWCAESCRKNPQAPNYVSMVCDFEPGTDDYFREVRHSGIKLVFRWIDTNVRFTAFVNEWEGSRIGVLFGKASTRWGYLW